MMCKYGKRKASWVFVISLLAGIGIGFLWRYMDYLIDLLCFMCVNGFNKPENMSTALQDPEPTEESQDQRGSDDSVDTSQRGSFKERQ
jgi:hypothetical protein